MRLILKTLLQTAPIVTDDMPVTMLLSKKLSKKAAIKKVRDESLKISDEYMNIKVLKFIRYIQAYYFFQEWADCVKEGLSQHLYSPHMMTSWLACMAKYLHMENLFVDRTERIVMIHRCLPRLFELLEYYTLHPVLETCHEVCRAVVRILRTMADLFDDRNACRLRAICIDAEYQPFAEETRKYADGVMTAYLTRLTADEQYLRHFSTDYDSHPAKLRDVENIWLWVKGGMYLSRIPCPCCCKQNAQ